MRVTRAAWLGVVAGTLAFGLWAQSAGPTVPYPDGYRQWIHVKSTLIGPSSPAFANNGGIHHFYANAKALEGYQSGTFPDGSVLIDDRLEAKESAGVTSVGSRYRVAAMVKDARRFPETGGWGFEIFKGDSREGSLDPAGRAACFACHTRGRDSVFSEFRP